MVIEFNINNKKEDSGCKKEQSENFLSNPLKNDNAITGIINNSF